MLDLKLTKYLINNIIKQEMVDENVKKIKKILTILGVFVFAFILTGCGKSSEKVTDSLETVMEKLYADVAEEEKPMALTNTELNDENIESYIGTDDVDFDEALASESMTGSIAHSVVLLKVDENDDIEDVKKTIKENVNPRKWICVGVEDEDVIIKNKENLVLVVIIEDETVRNKISEAFDNLK